MTTGIGLHENQHIFLMGQSVECRAVARKKHPHLTLFFFALLALGLSAWIFDYFFNIVDTLKFWLFFIVGVRLMSIVLAHPQARPILQRLVAVLLSVVLTLIAGEMILRLLVAESWAPLSMRCFKNRIQATWPYPVEEQKRPGSYRILCLGDSFGQVGGRGNFHYLIWDMAKRERRPVEIVNLSLGGYQVDMERDVLLQFGERYHPDLVLHNFYAGNDYELDAKSIFYINNLPFTERDNSSYWRPHHFYLPMLMTNLNAINQEKHRMAAEALIHKTAPGFFSENTYLALVFNALCVCDSSRPLRGNGPRIRQILEETRQETLRLGARYALVLHPAEFQVNGVLREAVQRRFPFNPARCDLKAPQRFIREYADSAGIPLMDLLEETGADQLQPSSYLLRDAHYNEEGNQKAARAIWRFLNSKGLIPGPGQGEQNQ